MSDWRPIETAPKDGTTIILAVDAYCDTNNWCWESWEGYGKTYVMCGCWDDDAWIGRRDDIIYRATHWMPLPPPPSTNETSQEGGD